MTQTLRHALRALCELGPSFVTQTPSCWEEKLAFDSSNGALAASFAFFLCSEAAFLPARPFLCAEIYERSKFSHKTPFLEQGRCQRPGCAALLKSRNQIGGEARVLVCDNDNDSGLKLWWLQQKFQRQIRICLPSKACCNGSTKRSKSISLMASNTSFPLIVFRLCCIAKLLALKGRKETQLSILLNEKDPSRDKDLGLFYVATHVRSEATPVTRLRKFSLTKKTMGAKEKC